MLYYELKKVFSRGGSKVALLLLVVLIAVVVGVCINSSQWVNENGVLERGFGAIKKLREASAKWSGPLTEDRIAQVITENDRINATPQAQSEDTQQQNIAYGWKQGFMDIRDLINYSFCAFREYDYFRVDSLNTSDAASFYTNRITSLKSWLNGEAKYYYSEREKEYLVSRFEMMRQPIYYEYMGGWNKLLEYITVILMIMTIIIGVLIAPIFSCERQLDSDSVFYAAYHGRGKAIAAKIKAGLLITTIVYWGTVLIYFGVVLGVYGMSGSNCLIQTAGMWKSFYNMTILQLYLIVIIGGYVGCVFMASLTMFVSAKFNSTVLAAIIPFILIFAPTFLGFLDSRLMSKVIGLLPDQLLQMNVVIKLFNVYEIGGNVVGAVGLLFGVYILFTILLQPSIFWVYRKST